MLCQRADSTGVTEDHWWGPGGTICLFLFRAEVPTEPCARIITTTPTLRLGEMAETTGNIMVVKEFVSSARMRHLGGWH